jgi:ABC-2 type transport system permease protein
MYVAFLLLCALFAIERPWKGAFYALPAILLCGLMLNALGLPLSVTVKQLENVARGDEFRHLPHVLSVLGARN